MVIFESKKASNDITNNDAMCDDEVVASYVPPSYLFSYSPALLLPVPFNGRSIPSGLWWRREDKWWWRRRKENINYDQRMNESRISLRIAFGHFKEREWLRHHSQSFFLAPLDWYTVQPRHDAPAFNEIQSIKYANHNSRKYFQSYLHVRNDKNLSKEHNFN